MLATSPIHPNRHPHPIHHPPRNPLLQAFFANPEAPAVTPDPMRLQDMPPQAQRAISAYPCASSAPARCHPRPTSA